MSRKFNFYAGPATLPLPVLEAMAKDFVDYKGMGMSLIETSHRSKEYDEVHFGAINITKELLGVGDDYKVMLLQGGATMQFGMLPMNLLHSGRKAAYVHSGAWAKKAISDAKKCGAVEVVWNGEASKYMTLPNPADLKVAPEAVYCHITSNETIGGVQWQEFPDVGVPLAADMSSDMMSRPLPMDKFGFIYAGAQKNLGPAGLTLAIIRKDLLEKCADNLVAYLKYKTHADSDSLYNTPPVFSIWTFKLTMEWLKAQGGLVAAAERAEKKAAMIYDAIDGSNGYYRCPVDKGCRSRMNVVWRLPSEELEEKFVKEGKAKGMLGLKGHRDVGGIRASIYNAMPAEGVALLAQFMDDFKKANG
ncbi:MAG: 3-phosphoserine/phosphohydroxythreonine transaminase [Deltaproteobacteria bacterium]|nr:3-phosphoserine/phosphohydroxythreonine transaminase [Deltaproteobacteria bacterium]